MSVDEEIDIMQDKELDEAIQDLLKPTNSIILFNDEVNSFEHVIYCLRLYCEHTMGQAEQCALIAHTNGKCVIKSGGISELVPIFAALTEKNLTVEIQ